MVEYEYPDDIEDEELDTAEKQADLQQEVYGDTTPTYKEKEDLYSLFWKVVKTDESSKVGNLKKDELGMLDLSVRDCQRIALIAEMLGHPGFASFFVNEGEIILSTSASKEGWLPELFISQKKLQTRMKKQDISVQPIGPPPKKRGLFGRR